MSADAENKKQLGRRKFLQSLFGLPLRNDVDNVSTTHDPHATSFLWCNLENGQVAFPTGTNIPSGTPGGLFAPVMAAAFLEKTADTGNLQVACLGATTIGNRTYRCPQAHGRVDAAHAIGLPCEVFFASIAEQVGAQSIIEYARQFGLDCPAAGYRPRQFPTEAQFLPADYALGTAADLSVNAVQLLRLVATIGLLRNPPFLHDASEEAVADGTASPLLSGQTWLALQQGARLGARQSIAAQLDPEDRLRLAALTTFSNSFSTPTKFAAGYFPYDAPRHAFCFAFPASLPDHGALDKGRSFLLAADWP